MTIIPRFTTPIPLVSGFSNRDSSPNRVIQKILKFCQLGYPHRDKRFSLVRLTEHGFPRLDRAVQETWRGVMSKTARWWSSGDSEKLPIFEGNFAIFVLGDFDDRLGKLRGAIA